MREESGTQMDCIVAKRRLGIRRLPIAIERCSNSYREVDMIAAKSSESIIALYYRQNGGNAWNQSHSHVVEVSSPFQEFSMLFRSAVEN